MISSCACANSAVFAANGREYLISVKDPAALERFYGGLSNNDFYTAGGPNGDEFMDESIWQKEYERAKKYMEKNGYSKNDAMSYALSYIMDYFDMGLTISSRQGAVNEFKEQKTATEGSGDSTKYKPTICP